MRLYNFLNDEIKYKTPLGEKVKYKELSNLISKHCKNNFLDMKKSKKWLFRGDKKWKSNIGVYLLSNENRGERQSAHTYNNTNHYTELMSNLLPSWKEWPKRNKAVICSTNPGQAGQYSGEKSPYYVIPFDNTPIAICSNYDIWYSFTKLQDLGFQNMNNFNYSFFTFDTPNFKKDKYDELTKLTNYRRDLDKWLSVKVKDFDYEPWLAPGEFEQINFQMAQAFKKFNNGTFRDVLNYFMDPKSNKFILTKSCSNLPFNKEVWFDGDGIAFSMEIDIEGIKL